MGINKNCIGINRSYFANKKYVVHPSRATTSCTIEIILVSLAFDDRVPPENYESFPVFTSIFSVDSELGKSSICTNDANPDELRFI